MAVEPTDGMRAELTRVLPGVPALAGSAEQIPLGDGTVDVVLAAQAWHWVDPAQGSRRSPDLLPDAERAAVLNRVRQLTQTHPALAGRPDIILPYRTLCWRGRLA